MKKLLSIILIFVFLFALTACAGKDNQNVSADESTLPVQLTVLIRNDFRLYIQ